MTWQISKYCPDGGYLDFIHHLVMYVDKILSGFEHPYTILCRLAQRPCKFRCMKGKFSLRSDGWSLSRCGDVSDRKQLNDVKLEQSIHRDQHINNKGNKKKIVRKLFTQKFKSRKHLKVNEGEIGRARTYRVLRMKNVRFDKRTRPQYDSNLGRPLQNFEK